VTVELIKHVLQRSHALALVYFILLYFTINLSLSHVVNSSKCSLCYGIIRPVLFSCC
jgi:hypothetical protein